MDGGGVHHRWNTPSTPWARAPTLGISWLSSWVLWRFFIWTVRVANKPQMAVNVVALALGAVGFNKINDLAGQKSG